jgi:hypothetical protein
MGAESIETGRTVTTEHQASSISPPGLTCLFSHPIEWVVYGTHSMVAPVVEATAYGIYQGWLVLWDGRIPVGVFKPECWSGVYRRKDRKWQEL